MTTEGGTKTLCLGARLSARMSDLAAGLIATALDISLTEAAERIRSKPQAEMAEAAEQLVAGTGWLPAALRMPEPEAEQPVPAEGEDAGIVEPSEAEAPDTEAEDGEAAYSVAAE